MLVLQRKAGESLILFHPAIGDIKIKIAEFISYRRVKIGVTAPESVEVRREELPARASQCIEEVPETFYAVDRAKAKIGMSPLALAYVERLEATVRASDAFWTSMQMCVMSPRQYALSEELLEANGQVNFCSEQDSMELPTCHCEEEELSREIIWS